MAIKSKDTAETIYQSYVARHRSGEYGLKEKAKKLCDEHELEHNVDADFPTK